jgi:CheY-like chemotaxis protein
MAKILLVEDDNNLREIYQARLQAEGYDIISARDGEEALVVAKQEMPDLVISDVMMPKISGFEMLDILRNTEGLQHVKVIMLTALGQAEDQTRADCLGADRYLVKSQVTLEDIVNAAKDLLSAPAAAAAAAPADVVPAATGAVATETPAAPAPAETAVAAEAPSTPEPAPTPEAPVAEAPAPEAPAVPLVIPVATEPPLADDNGAAGATTSATDDVVPTDDNQSAEPQSNQQETATVEKQIEDFVQTQSGTPEPAAEPAPAAVDVTPETTQPETEPAPAPEVPAEPTTTPEQEQALNDALTSLNGGDEAAVGAPATETTPATEPAVAEAPEEDGPSAHKKVIEPLHDDVAPKKSLDELLAAEEAKEASPTSGTADQPADAPKPPANKDDFDPNSIAL